MKIKSVSPARPAGRASVISAPSPHLPPSLIPTEIVSSAEEENIPQITPLVKQVEGGSDLLGVTALVQGAANSERDKGCLGSYRNHEPSSQRSIVQICL